MIAAIVALGWFTLSPLVALVVGAGIRLADVMEGHAAPRTTPRLPAHLSPRAGLAGSRTWRRARRALRAHPEAAGLLAACVLALAISYATRGQALTWAGWVDVPTGGAR